MPKCLFLAGGLLLGGGAQAQVAFSEIMADPTPEVGLPPAEYVEIRNLGSDTVQLAGWTLADATRAATFPEYALPPQGWLLLCASSQLPAFQPYGPALALPNFPSLNNSGERLLLSDSQGNMMDEVDFSPSWHEAGKRDGGWSLERFSFGGQLCGGAVWGSSQHPLGGTPGQPNSQRPPLPPPSVSALLRNDTLRLGASQPLPWALGRYALETPQGSRRPLPAPALSGPEAHWAWPAELPLGVPYRFHIEGLARCEGGTLDTAIWLPTGRAPSFLDLAITEIMADPTPSHGLPEEEYVEIHNRTQAYLNLQGCWLEDASRSAALPDTLMPPNAYWVLTGTSAAARFARHAIGIPSFPSLSNEGERLRLRHERQGLLFTVSYRDAWYGDLWAKEGGVALEMLDIGFPCQQEGNWEASADPRGGTPGEANSQRRAGSDGRPPQVLLAHLPDSQQVVLEWDELLHPDTSPRLRAEWRSGRRTVGWALEGERLLLQVAPPFARNEADELQLSGATDCAGNIALGLEQAVFRPDTAQPGDVVIHEVLPLPAVGGKRFLEVKNRSQKYLDLQGWRAGRMGEGGLNSWSLLAEGPVLLAPGDIIAFTEDPALLLAYFPKGNALAIRETPEALPAWAPEPDQAGVWLYDGRFRPIDSMWVLEGMIFPMIDEQRGVSLERVDADAPSDWAQNWQSAAGAVGYATPGLPNSQERPDAPREADGWQAWPPVFSPDGDGYQDLALLQYAGEKPGSVANILIFDARGGYWGQLASNHLLAQEGFYAWDGRGPQGQEAPAGVYIFYIETFRLQGERRMRKCLVGLQR
jgi:hypothetical protein